MSFNLLAWLRHGALYTARLDWGEKRVALKSQVTGILSKS